MTSPEIEASAGGLEIVRHADWSARFPWLVQGVTLRPLDFAPASPPAAWERLRAATGMARVARVRQVHGTRTIAIGTEAADGPERPEGDALAAARPGILLAITVADCVPVFAVDPGRRVLGLAHAGWRGAAAGVVEGLIDRMERELGARREEMYVHLGPAICGRCYEVGPDVAAAFGLGSEARHLDLRDRIRTRVRRAGLDLARITRSNLCTRCTGERLYSYRGGDRNARMCAFLGAVAG